MDEINNYLQNITGWLNNNNIGKDNNKKKDIAWSIFRSAFENNITLEILNHIKSYILKKEFVIKEGNIWDELGKYFKNSNEPILKENNKNIIKFFKTIFNSIPSGLSTSPNAACGKGELFYRLLRPKSSQPKKGDIKDNGEKIELKGCETRIQSLSITGKQYKIITDKLFKGKIQGQCPSTGGLKGKECFEIEKYEEHFKKEFRKRSLEENRASFTQLLEELNIDGNIEEKVKQIIPNDNNYNQDVYKNILLEDWFDKNKKDAEFDKLIILGDGSNIKIITDYKDLKNKIEITKDYFRINQDNKLAWYIE